MLNTALELGTPPRGNDASILQAWLKSRLQALPFDVLPLHRATRMGGWVDERRRDFSLLRIEPGATHWRVIVTVFFEEIISGCNCDDDPHSTPASCALSLQVDRVDGSTIVSLLPD